MKKVLLIGFVALIFLAILAAILFKIFSPAAPATQTQTPTPLPLAPTGATIGQPDQFAKAFYTWYLENISRNAEFPYTEDLNKVFGPWLTQDFIDNWNDLQSNFETDPALLTTDDPTPWDRTITTSILSQSATITTLHLTIAAGTEHVHAYTVTLVKNAEGTGWKISRIEYAAP